MLERKNIGFIGGGAIAEALIHGILQTKLVNAEQITVADIMQERLQYLAKTFAVSVKQVGEEVAAKADLLFLTVKPQVTELVLTTIAPFVSEKTLIVSIVAGVTLTTLQEKFPHCAIIRVMPNTPVAVGEGMSAMALGQHATVADEASVSSLLAAAGKVVTVPESMMDAVTGLSGSGPGYAFVIIDALADAGVRVGIPRLVARQLAAQTLLGAAKMVLETGKHPAELRDMVTSPGGTTIAGIHILEKQGIRAALSDAVAAATERSREMGKK